MSIIINYVIARIIVRILVNSLYSKLKSSASCEYYLGLNVDLIICLVKIYTKMGDKERRNKSLHFRISRPR